MGSIRNKQVRMPPKISGKDRVDLFYLICGLWFVFQVTLTALSFFKVAISDEYWVTRAFIFGFLLLFYWIRNEFSKMKGTFRKKKKGHLFVAFWLLFIVALAIISLASEGKYRLPFRAVENTIYIFSVYFGRTAVKIMARWKARGRKLLKAYALQLIFGRWASRIFLREQARKCRKNARKRKKERVMSDVPIIRI